jgi:hypothetical protein
MAELRDEQEAILMRLVQQHQRQPPDEPAGPSSSDATWLQYYSLWLDEDAAVSPRVVQVLRSRNRQLAVHCHTLNVRFALAP